MTPIASRLSFDEICQIKGQLLSSEDQCACERFLHDKKEMGSPYLERLHAVFSQQLQTKLGPGMGEISPDFFEHRVYRLMRAFLNEKLGRQKAIEPAYDLADRAKWDPHSHGASLFARLFPETRYHLPDFEAAYIHLRPFVNALGGRRAEIVKESMERKECAQFTEVGIGTYGKWLHTHNGKKMLPIVSYVRGRDNALRDDVVGYDYCGQEEELKYGSTEAFLKRVEEGQVARVHMGETTLPEKGREHVSLFLDEAEKYYRSSKPLRIGHGTHISLNDMQRVVKKGYYIEACLSSNKKTGIIGKRSEYPLGIMLLLGVKVVIGTDGDALYNTSLAQEYAYAVRSLEKFCDRLNHSDDEIQLLNGDRLCVRHVAHLLKEVEGSPSEALTYRQLGVYLKDEVRARLSADQLVQNAQDLFAACYASEVIYQT